MESSANDPAMFLLSDGPGLLPREAREPLTQACLSRASAVTPGLHEQTQQLHALKGHRMSPVSPSHLRKPIKCVGRVPVKRGAVSEECRMWWIEAGSNIFSVFTSRGETIWRCDCSDQEHLAEVNTAFSGLGLWTLAVPSYLLWNTPLGIPSFWGIRVLITGLVSFWLL